MRCPGCFLRESDALRREGKKGEVTVIGRDKREIHRIRKLNRNIAKGNGELW